MKSESSPLISVCIPVFGTEPYLFQCLRSVFTQDFSSFEIIVVSDRSCGLDEKGRGAKKIVKIAQKECKKYRKKNKLPEIKIKFIEHRENRGLIEVRRTLAFEAEGFYITQVDSDDEMESGALSVLWRAVIENVDIDIVHGKSTAGTFDEEGNFTPSKENRYGKIFYGKIEGREVFRRWLLGGEFTANTWGKLIKRKLWLRGFENIPYTQCNMADDLLLFFFIAQYAKSYLGIEKNVYRYRVNSGMTSNRKIDNLQKWRMICSTASVFSIISEYIAHSEKKALEESLQPDEIAHIRKLTGYYLLNNLKQMKETVVPELQEEARKMLCEYWGETFVEKMEKSLS